MSDLKTYGFMVAIESNDRIKLETMNTLMEHGLDYLGVDYERFDVGPLGEIDCYPGDDEDKE